MRGGSTAPVPDDSQTGGGRGERPAFLTYNQNVIREFRANGGVVTEPDFPIVLLTTTGARTGRRTTTPLAYTIDGERIFVVASNAGAPTDPAWLHNVRANPSVMVELGSDVYEARAIVAEGEERDRLYSIKSQQGPALRVLQQRTTRLIPFVLLEGVLAPVSPASAEITTNPIDQERS
jgi:deazaflavin-dependent oxidoreductase (nitroreductase family)